MRLMLCYPCQLESTCAYMYGLKEAADNVLALSERLQLLRVTILSGQEIAVLATLGSTCRLSTALQLYLETIPLLLIYNEMGLDIIQ